MDDLQYKPTLGARELLLIQGFKPCYKWMTFNTEDL